MLDQNCNNQNGPLYDNDSQCAQPSDEKPETNPGSESRPFGPPTILVHPAVDFVPGGMTVGFKQPRADHENQLVLIVMDGAAQKAETDPEQVDIGGTTYSVKSGPTPPLLHNVWHHDSANDFLLNPVCRTSIFQEIKDTIQKYLKFPASDEYGLISLWAISTYFSQAFYAFPYVLFMGPKESGKSNALEVLSLIAHNAMKTKNLTESSLGDYLESCRGTVFIDQAEALPSKIVGILADAYKKAGGKRMITQGKGTKRTYRSYSLYGAKGFATTKPLDLDLLDRCILISMRKSKKPLADLCGNEPIWADLRDGLFRFLLCRYAEVQEAYQAIESTGNRQGELWRPLEAVARVIGLPEAEISEIRQTFYLCTAKTKAEPSQAELLMLQAIADAAATAAGDFLMTAQQIQSAIAPSLPKKDLPSVQWIGQKIAVYGLYKADGKVKRSKRKETFYNFSPGHVKAITDLYL